MVQITGGTVSYQRRVKTGDFEWKEFTTSAAFTPDAKEDPADALKAASRIIVNHTHEMVGLLRAAPGTVKATPEGEAAKAAFAQKAEAPAEKPKRGAAKPPASKKAAAPTGQAISEGEPGEGDFDPLADDVKPAVELPDDDITDLLGEQEPVTDEELNKAAVAKAQQTKNGAAIRQLGAKFGGGPAPKTLRNIPQDKRHQFLDELKKL